MATIGFDAIETQWRIETEVALTSSAASALEDRIAGLDQIWSRFRAESLVAHMARAGYGKHSTFPKTLALGSPCMTRCTG